MAGGAGAAVNTSGAADSQEKWPSPADAADAAALADDKKKKDGKKKDRNK